MSSMVKDMISMTLREFFVRINTFIPAGCDVTVRDRVSEDSQSWYGYWNGVDMCATLGSTKYSVHVYDMISGPNGYGGTDVTYSHMKTKRLVISKLKQMRCNVTVE